MTRRLLVALVGGGFSTLVLGELVPIYVSAPVVVVVAFALAVILSRLLSEPFTQRLEQEREFSANVSHQLRTPLAALRLRLEDMSLWPSTDDEQSVELDACVGEVDRLAGTIDDFLALARDGGVGPSGVVDLCKATAIANERWSSEFASKGRLLELDHAVESLRVKTSERALFQVIDVLLENAIAHGDGVTTLSVASRGKHALVLVTDEGHLDPNDASRMFERSYRSASSAGSGIGLALASDIALGAGIVLQLASLSPTSFELRIPRK